jgi:tetratricopeptide (TPR) repeat protein
VKTRLIIALSAVLVVGCEKCAQLTREEPTRDEQAQALIERGNAALEAESYEVAAQLFEQAAAFSATNPEPHLALGRIHARMGNDGQAILALQRAVELLPGDVEARKQIAELYLRHGKPGTAVDHLRKAVEVAEGPPDEELMRGLAAALLRAGELDEAEAMVERIDRAAPGNPETLALYAEILIARGDEERAVRLLDVAVASGQDSARVRLARARYFNSRGKVEPALREFELAARADPGNPNVALARARALSAARRFEEAAEVMEEVVLARPSDLNVQASLAEVKLMAGETAAAQQIAEAVIARQANNGRALYVRARAIEDQSADDPVRAINAYRRVVDADANQVEALSRLWRLQAKVGEQTEAITALEHLLLLGEATSEEEIELAGLYGDTGINVARGLKLVAAAYGREPGNPRLPAIKRALEEKARALPPRGGPGSGIQVLKGGR